MIKYVINSAGPIREVAILFIFPKLSHRPLGQQAINYCRALNFWQ